MYSLKHRDIILASSSKSRQTLLKNAKVDFLVKRPFVDEESIRESAIAEKTTLRECAILLAEMKGPAEELTKLLGDWLEVAHK